MAGAPHGAEARRRSGCRSVPGDQRRDRHQVVGVGRVAQPEQEGDAERDDERRALEEAGEGVIDVFDHRSASQSGQAPTSGKWAKRGAKPRGRGRRAAAPSRSSSGTCGRSARTPRSRRVAAAEHVAAGAVARGGRGGRARPPRAPRGCGRRDARSAPARRRAPRRSAGASAAKSASSTSRRAVETRRPRARRVPSAAVGVGRGSGSAQGETAYRGSSSVRAAPAQPGRPISSQRPRDRIMRDLRRGLDGEHEADDDDRDALRGRQRGRPARPGSRQPARVHDGEAERRSASRRGRG